MNEVRNVLTPGYVFRLSLSVFLFVLIHLEARAVAASVDLKHSTDSECTMLLSSWFQAMAGFTQNEWCGSEESGSTCCCFGCSCEQSVSVCVCVMLLTHYIKLTFSKAEHMTARDVFLGVDAGTFLI